MRYTGMVRRIDELGRVVIPKELRRTFGIKDNEDSFEIFVEDNMIILKKYEPACIFCDNIKGVTTYKGHNICPDCLRELAEKQK